ncbi:MAG: MarR family winged helix-turn-helix transcriptional regulator [Stackebrandtia sp.]
MNDSTGIAAAFLLLSTAGTLVERIGAGVRDRGFDDLRPACGFAFARIAPSGATVSELAAHLGVTKQAASQLTEELVAKGYVARGPHPADARAKLLTLTDRGWEAARAAEQAAAEVVEEWSKTLGRDRVAALAADLSRIATPGRLRPIW